MHTQIALCPKAPIDTYLFLQHDEPGAPMMTLSTYWMIEVASMSAIDSRLAAIPLHVAGVSGRRGRPT